MGTNFYWHERPPCPWSEREYDPLHIGKSSTGWCFSLHIIPEKNINDLGDWEHLWRLGGHIEDEYGATITQDEMLDMIVNRSGHGLVLSSWTPEDLRSNSAELGPHGLARHIVDGWHCVGHGDGTWDLITGEFS